MLGFHFSGNLIDWDHIGISIPLPFPPSDHDFPACLEPALQKSGKKHRL